MDADNQHTVLIVDDDRKAAQTMGTLLEEKNIAYSIADSGSSALNQLSKATPAFSLIIVNQAIEEIKGTQLLEHAKNICPDTQRFLLTDYSDVTSIMNAVNKGAIQQCILKPWQPDDLLDAVLLACKQFERNQENEKLLSLAKEQNAALFELNCKLMETTKSLTNEIKKIEHDIDGCKEKIAQLSQADTISIPPVLQVIQESLDTGSTTDPDKVTQLLDETIRLLHKQFNDIAQRHGFEMPATGG